MVAEYRLKAAVDEWRSELSDRFTIGEQARLEAEHADEIAAIIAAALPILRARAGEKPETIEDFAAYDAIVKRERPCDLMSDGAVVKRLARRVDRMLAGGDPEWSVFQNTAREYIVSRAEAMLLRGRGWDAVTLLITAAPAIAVVASDTVVAVRHLMGGLYIHPYRRGTLNHLHGDMHRAEAKVLFLMEDMKAGPPKIKVMLAPFARELWRLARKARIEVFR